MNIEKYIASMLAPKMYKNFYRRERQDEITGNDTLMIIDMQPGFFNAIKTTDLYNKTNYHLTKVQEAMENDANILYIEYHDSGPTAPALLIPALEYLKLRRFVKVYDDGFKGTSLDKIVKSFNPEVVHAMGCFAECCVARTVAGGMERGLPMAIHLPGLISRDSSEANMMKALMMYNEYNVPVVRKR